jgi:hypothetical protein
LWKTSTAANEKLRILRDTKVDYIIQYTQSNKSIYIKTVLTTVITNTTFIDNHFSLSFDQNTVTFKYNFEFDKKNCVEISIGNLCYRGNERVHCHQFVITRFKGMANK